MTLEEAIEILTQYMEGLDEAWPVDFDKAIDLGIEALKRVSSEREKYTGWSVRPLPEETEF